jgi:hypothetical protein
MRSLGGDENEVALSQQELEFINGAVLHEMLHVMEERSDPVFDAGFVPNHMITAEILLGVAMISSDVEGLVVFPHERFVLLGILGFFASVGPSVCVCPLSLGGAAGAEKSQCSTIMPSSNLKISKKTPRPPISPFD